MTNAKTYKIFKNGPIKNKKRKWHVATLDVDLKNEF